MDSELYQKTIDELNIKVFENNDAINGFGNMQKHPTLSKFKCIENLEEINKDVFLYKNFMNKAYEEFATFGLNNLPDERWYGEHYRYDLSDHIENDGRNISLGVIGPNMHIILVNISNFFNPEYNIVYYGEFFRTRPKDDNEVEPKISNTKSADYAVVYFLGEFTGGELYFPSLDWTYQPKSNDLLIFSTKYFEELISRNVKTGIKYTYQNYAVPEIGSRYL